MSADLELCYLPATKAIDLFKKKKLSPVELMTAAIARAEETNPKINAFSFTFFDEALALAKKAEARYARGAKTGALEGLPIGIKDENYLLGKPTSYGLIDKDIIAEKNSPNNERILNAHGIPTSRTTVPELSITPYTSSTRFGVTRNPWNLDFTPGGSTGGGSAALAVGAISLAMGSDIGGSIRIPASCGGLVGYKPPHGRNPDDAPFNLDAYCHTGPLGRNVADVMLLQNVISGCHPSDMTSIREKVILSETRKSIKGWRIAYSIDLGHYEVDHEVRKNTLAALKIFKDLGCVVEEVDLGWTKKSYEATATHLAQIFGTQVDMYLKEGRKKVKPYTRDFGRLGAKLKLHDCIRAMDEECRMYEAFSKVMEDGKFDIFICPTMTRVNNCSIERITGRFN